MRGTLRARSVCPITALKICCKQLTAKRVSRCVCALVCEWVPMYTYRHICVCSCKRSFITFINLPLSVRSNESTIALAVVLPLIVVFAVPSVLLLMSGNRQVAAQFTRPDKNLQHAQQNVICICIVVLPRSLSSPVVLPLTCSVL